MTFIKKSEKIVFTDNDKEYVIINELGQFQLKDISDLVDNCKQNNITSFNDDFFNQNIESDVREGLKILINNILEKLNKNI